MKTKEILDRLESLAIANAGKQRKLDQQKRMLRVLREQVDDQAETIRFLKEDVGALTGQVCRLEDQLGTPGQDESFRPDLNFQAPRSACEAVARDFVGPFTDS